jgi:hypothetical protein
MTENKQLKIAGWIYEALAEVRVERLPDEDET